MATPTTSTAPPKLHINAMHTVMPATVTEPGRRRRISVAASLQPESLQNRFYVVLYYNKAEESPLEVAAWIRESLNAALPEQPLLSGRLRKENESSGYWEMQFNDAGVRLVQASVPEMTMSEFLECKDRDEREAHLAYWEDVDQDNPDFSALFYIQVTQFKGDAYSIGISCSLLLADPLFLTRFLKSWTRTHVQMLAQGKLLKPPIFHLSYFQRPGRPTHLKTIQLDSTRPPSTMMLFKVARTVALPPSDALASACLQEATMKVEKTTSSGFTLIINDHNGDLKLEPNNMARSIGGLDGTSNVAWWDEFGFEDLMFVEGNKPARVSYRVISSEGLVVVMIPSDEDLLISATLPNN